MLRLAPDYPPPKSRRRAYLKTFLPPCLAFGTIVLGLTSYALLLRYYSPAVLQHIGWQAWDVVQFTAGGAGHASNASELLSLPLDIYDPLAGHTTGMTEVIVKSCIFPPTVMPSLCFPKSSSAEEAAKGKWVLVKGDVDKRTGLWYLNVYYRRSRRLDVPLITELQMLSEPPPSDEDLDGWTKADGNLHAGMWPQRKELRLWYKMRDQHEAKATDNSDLVTELIIHYGDDEPFFGFKRVAGGKIVEAKEEHWEGVDLACRHGNPAPPQARQPLFKEDGSFKLLQIADLHYSVGAGECRDTNKTPCSGDADTATWLGQVLDAETPDMVVFSGDQLNGQKTSYDSRSVLAKFAKPVIERRIPWVVVFGNHDSEIAEDREQQMRALQQMPYSLARAGPAGVDGVGNYDITLLSGDASHTPIFTLYFLDSHAYETVRFPWMRAGYDYIKQSQIDWYLKASSAVQAIERPFHPDGGKDLGNVWARGPHRLPRQKTLAKPNAMMFFHIPLEEAYLDADATEDKLFANGSLDLGVQHDPNGSSKRNGGLFENGIKAALESDDAAIKISEVKVLGHGHCHNTDRCRRVAGIWMCFDGGSSYSGYGELGFDRRVRVYNISQWGEKIETYKHLTTGEIVDKQVLVGEGAPGGWGQGQ